MFASELGGGVGRERHERVAFAADVSRLPASTSTVAASATSRTGTVNASDPKTSRTDGLIPSPSGVRKPSIACSSACSSALALGERKPRVWAAAVRSMSTAEAPSHPLPCRPAATTAPTLSV